MIETQRLVIRLAEVADVPEIIRFYGENQEHLQPYAPTNAADFLDEAKWLDGLRVRADELAAGSAFRAFLFPRAMPNRIVGNLSLMNVHRGALQSCVIGYNLAAAEQGKGYMTEAVRAAVAFAFGTWKLHRVEAGYMPRNTSSAAVLERCGFKVVGTAPAYLLINGRWEDHVLTAITNPSWEPQTS